MRWLSATVAVTALLSQLSSASGTARGTAPWLTAPGLIDPLECQSQHPALAAHQSAIIFTHNLYNGKINEALFKKVAKFQAKGVDIMLITPPEDERDNSAWGKAAKKKHWRLGQTRGLSDVEKVGAEHRLCMTK